jgi:hypothetical protein
MVAAPASAFIELGEIVEPLFGDDAPPVEDILGVLADVLSVVSLGHEKVRKEENGRRRNERINAVLVSYSVENFGEVQRFAAKMRRPAQTSLKLAPSSGNSHLRLR